MLTLIAILTLTAALSLACHIAADRTDSMGATLVLTALSLPVLPLVAIGNAARAWNTRRIVSKHSPY
jgi:hypothetical protein